MSSINTGIEWTDKTWNPTTGCDKISTGCLHCYAEAITQRFPKNFPNGFSLTLHPERLKEPLRWRTPSRVFVNSMSDLFHDDVPLDFIRQVFSVIHSTPWHIYQILTKRQSRLGDLASKLDFPENIWLGVSVENQNHIDRIEYLRTVPVSVRFISCEPLLGPLELNLTGIDWVHPSCLNILVVPVSIYLAVALKKTDPAANLAKELPFFAHQYPDVK